MIIAHPKKPAPMRRLLLKLLLIAVFLNTAVGMPLHAAAHLAGSEAPHSTSAPDDDDGGERAHLPCAGCVAHAEASGGPPAAPDVSRAGDVQLFHARPASAAGAGFSAGLWASSPRGPPR